MKNEKTVSDSLSTLEKPDDFHGVRFFLNHGGFSSDWFKNLSDATQLYYQRSYWNASNACFSEDPFPEARIQILGSDEDVLWEKINLDDICAVYRDYFEYWVKHPKLKPKAFKNFDLLLEEVANYSNKTLSNI